MVDRMKRSQFIISTNLDNNTFLVNNMVNGNIFSLTTQEFINFNEILDNPNAQKSKLYDLYNDMIEAKFLLDDDICEINVAKHLHWRDRLNRTSLNFTITPSFACNMSCSYCYQKGYSNNKMSEATVEKIYKFIEAEIKNLKSIYINWFGGETLLQLDIISYLNKKIIKLCETYKVDFNNTIATNGYLLNSRIIEELKAVKVSEIGITLGGTKEMHDCMRKTKEGLPTFDVIMGNIEKAKEHFKIMLNINITKTNLSQVKELLCELKNRQFDKNIYVYFNHVISYSNNLCDELCISENEFSSVVIDLYKHALNSGLNIVDPTKFGSSCMYCSVGHENSFAIDPHGYVYKCVEVFSDDNRYGEFDKDGRLILNDNLENKVFDPFCDIVCKKCDILPYCYGGCDYKRSKHENYCPIEKNNISEYLKLYYLRSEHSDCL